MITEAEIQSIDYASNSCTVRIPFFETLNTPQNVIIPARFAIQPGGYNGYKLGDGVWVAFENGVPENPIVISKIFKGSDIESKGSGGLSVNNLTVNETATIPLDTKISGTLEQYSSINAIINNLKTLQQDGQTGEVYKLVEQPVGTWIDGKTIYRQTIKYNNAIPATSWFKVGELSSKIDEVVKIDVVLREYGGWGCSYSSQVTNTSSVNTSLVAVTVRRYNLASQADAVYALCPISISSAMAPQIIAHIYYTKK